MKLDALLELIRVILAAALRNAPSRVPTSGDTVTDSAWSRAFSLATLPPPFQSGLCFVKHLKQCMPRPQGLRPAYLRASVQHCCSSIETCGACEQPLQLHESTRRSAGVSVTVVQTSQLCTQCCAGQFARCLCWCLVSFPYGSYPLSCRSNLLWCCRAASQAVHCNHHQYQLWLRKMNNAKATSQLCPIQALIVCVQL